MILSLACLLALLPSPAGADTVFLKNGNKMEGLVVREDGREVELDIGYGTVTLPRGDVRRVVRAPDGKKGEQERRRRAFDAGRSVPAPARALQRRFQELQARREAALDAKSRKADLEAEQERLSSELASLKSRYGPAKEELQAKRGAGPDAYNAAVQGLNDIATSAEAARIKLERSRKELESSGKDIQEYLAAFEELKEALAKDDRYSGRTEVPQDEREFYEGLKDMVREMDRDFSAGEASSEKRGPHVVVKASINGKVRASLLVDTGATIVTLSRRVFEKLELGPEAQRGEAEVTLADGRKLKALVVVLDSVEVGGMRARRVEAAVLPESDPQADGLLGMSFLKHFSFRLDTERNRLILKAVR